MNEKPKRVTLSRRRGWRMPANAVKVDRSTVFGNPWRVTENVSAKDAEIFYEEWLNGDHPDVDPERRQKLIDSLPHLLGKDLACWCAQGESVNCHANVLLRTVAMAKVENEEAA